MAQSPIEDILPLSPMQEGMLFHSLLDPDSGVDFEQLLYRFDGPFDATVLDAAWQQVVARHSALRARFVWQGVDRPLQLIEHLATVAVTMLDWSEAGPEPARQADLLESWLSQDRKLGVSLGEAPLMRVTLMRLGATEHLMALSFHHLLLDGWSVRLVLRDLLTCYRATLAGSMPVLEPAPKYSGYLRWLHAQDQDAAKSYWQDELGDFSTPTQLRSERRTSESGYGTAEIVFDEPASDRLKRFAREQRVTVNTLVQGAWALLLARYSGSADVVFGATMSTRPAQLDRVESMVGLMINTLPVRIRADPGQQVGNWLRGIQQSQLALRQFDYTPLVLAQACSGVPRGTALFDSILVFENYPKNSAEEQRPGDLRLTPVAAAERNGYPLSVVAAVREQLLLEITFDRSSFESQRIERLAGHLRTLLSELATDPNNLLGELQILTADERQLIVSDWNDTTTEYPSDRCIHELFEDQVRRAPDALAVTGIDGSQLSYRQLNERANQLAHRLRELGAGPERTVGICATASVEALVGLLGILKSGAGYVPLDPGHPPQRLAFMLEDTAAILVVSEPAGIKVLPPRYTGDRLLLLDADNPVTASMARTNPEPLAGPANLAYVMYTSGSTGKPKGVLVHHQGLVNYLWWAIEGYGLQGAAGAAMLGSIAFDLSMPNYFLPLIGGKDVTVLAADRSLESLRELLTKPGDFSLLKITPGHLDVLRHSLAGQLLDSVRTYVIGADEVKPETMAAWQKVAPGSRVINEYGPTETVVGCSIYVADENFDPSVPVPIGRPIANIRMYVLDEQLNPVPAGVIGELFIGGDGVARGYLNRPDITAERFIPDPFGNGRLYRTGDLARFRPDGDLEFLGRTDHQVKIRGYRIELGEIEARLLALDEIAEAVVIAREDTPGDRRLVAYLVATGEQPSASALRAWLEAALPSYMIPAAFVLLPALPLSGNGKVDRAALPAPDAGRRELNSGLVRPRTELEDLIAGIWCEVLGLAEVGVLDGFFDLGGHSLLATQVVSRLAGLGRGEVPLRVVFENPTVAGLAGWLAGSGQATLEPIQRADRDGLLPLSFGQQRLWFLDQLDPGSVEFLVPMAWRLTGQLDVEALRRALAATVARHEVLRSTFSTTDGYTHQRIHDAVPVSLPVIQGSAATAGAVLAELASQPFDLVTGPLWRAALVVIAEDQQVLLFATHHIVMDAWSVQNLAREVGESYRSILAGTAAELTPLPIQYADFAAWQRGWLQDNVLAGQLDYWRDALDGSMPLQLPTDRPRTEIRDIEGSSVDFTIPAAIATGLHQLARKQRVTLFMLMLAAVQTLLGRYAGQQDVVVGTPIANRNRAETEALIGFFVNTLVLRTDLSGDPTFVELLGRVREVTLGAYENQDLPFERLVEELRPDRDLARTPLFQVLLTVNNAPSAAWELPGLAVEDYSLSTGQAKYDLTLAFADTEEGLLGTVRYSTGLFDRSRIERLCGHLSQLLAEVVANPRAKLAELSILTAPEHDGLLAQGSLPAIEGTTGEPGLHRLVEAQIEATPEAVALVDEQGTELCYRELGLRANRLAQLLVGLRVGPDTLVGLYLERSIDAIVGMLAVLKAGAGYLPLDPEHPLDRTTLLLGNTGTEIVLTNAAHAAKLSGGFHGRIIELDTIDLAGQPETTPDVEVHPASVAYVVHTSGSTGIPKGVVSTHGAATIRICQLLADYQVGRQDTGVALAGLGFDASVREIFTVLAGGGQLLVCGPDTSRDPAAVLLALARHQVSVLLSVVPSMLYQLVAQPIDPTLLAGLRLVLCSGERLQPERLTGCDWLPATLINQFGPTETTMTATRAQAMPTDQPSWAYDVGRPVAGSDVYVLDPALVPSPVGVSGELYIGGPAVARGYWGKPALTAQRFVPNPFGAGRLYRTGDICRWSAAGTLEHQGRSDHQVKVRGFRVELDEIRAQLIQLVGVLDAVVVARPDEVGDQRLIGYLIADGGADELSTTELRAALEATLPDYLIPSVFSYLPQFPLTANGKIDRVALPEPTLDRPELASGFVGPRDPVEAEVAEIWSTVLGVQQIGVFDNFFDLGGHSLLAAHVVARLRARGHAALSLRTIFALPTVAELADQLAGGSLASKPAAIELNELVELNDGPADRILFCVHEGTGSITGYYELARLLQPDLRLVGIAFDDSLLESAAQDQLSAIAEAYLARIRARQPSGPYRLLGWSMGGLVAYELAAQLSRAGEQVEWVALVDSVPLAPETRTRDRVDRLLDELLALSGEIAEHDWTELAADRLTGHLRQLDLREEQIGLGKQSLESALRRNQFFRMAKRNYQPEPADIPMTVLKAADGNWEWPWFKAWLDYVPDAELVEVAGNHLSVMERPQLEAVVEAVRGRLALGSGELERRGSRDD
ncbi:MAG: amino acid adenylation domain-containing protein [Actinomycetota bacterium]|nr:amino acid adenylation domain-containing protein [Actinomycetota bacterium]